MRGRLVDILIKGATVLTMDPAIGDLPQGDVLVCDGRIAEVAKEIDVQGTQIIDASGCIVAPGLVDGHRHVWQSLLKGTMSDLSLPEYMVLARSMYCGCFDAEDAYLANYLGGIESIDAGITSVIDHCHLQSSPEVSLALADGLLDSGVGGVFCYALQNVPSYLDAAPGGVDEVRELLMSLPDAWHDEAARDVKERLAAHGSGRLAFGIALPEATPYLPAELAQSLFDRAAALEPALITGHWNASYRDGQYFSTLEDLAAVAALERATLLAHCNQCSDGDLDLLARKNVGLCTCGNIEAGMGLGPLLAFDFLARGGNSAIGLDIGSYLKTDLLADARLVLQAERRDRAAKKNELAREISPSAREALYLVTLGGARAAGLDAEVGSIEPGKRADMIIVSPDLGDTFADRDPAVSLLFYTSNANIDTVLCAGVVRKAAGKLVGVEEADLADRAKAAVSKINERYAQLSPKMMAAAWEGMF